MFLRQAKNQTATPPENPESTSEAPGASVFEPKDTQQFGMSVGSNDQRPRRNKTYVRGVNSLRYHIALLTAATVAITVGLMLAATFWTVSLVTINGVDRELEEKADSLLVQVQDIRFMSDAESAAERFKEYNPNLRISISPPGWDYYVGDDVAISQRPEQGGQAEASTINGNRVLVKSSAQGAVVILAQDLEPAYRILSQLGLWLLAFGALGLIIAVLSGWVAARTALRPVADLNGRIRDIAENDDLRPVPVVGKDEIAALARSFNVLVAALRDSRQRQAELVMDAGHELKTPLTSLRNNIELLQMVQQSEGMKLPPQEVEAMFQDIIAQLDELSTLIGDLVDLAREDSPETPLEVVDLEHVVETAATRARRRGASLEFRIETTEWYLVGDSHALERCIVNLLDNAAKWSPAHGVVRLTMRCDTQDAQSNRLRLEVCDSGPGIPPEDREKVFNRFYRSVQTRSTPGSGLGLSIVQSTVLRHGGTIHVADSSDGGCRMVMSLPGSTDEELIHQVIAQARSQSVNKQES